MRKQQQCVHAVALTMLAGTMASAAVTVDGRLTPGDNYGAAKWVNTVPTGFGDNVAGQGSDPGNPSTATTGVEFAIPYSALGYSGGALKISAFITGGGGFISNQFLGSLPLPTNNLGGNERNRDMNSIAGDQFVSFTPAEAAVPVIDGAQDTLYGSAKALQGNFTQFGNATNGDVVVANGGSEINGLYVVRNDATQTLTVLLTGNLQNNGNRLNIFFDTVAGGQNRILQTTGWLGNYGSDNGTNGFTFDTGFEADYALSINCTGGNTPRIFFDAATLPTDVGATTSYLGFANFPSGSGFDAPVLTPPEDGPASAIRATINNSNTLGVSASLGGNPAPNQFLAYGSEFNGVFAKIEGGKLFVLVTGNLESSFNKASFFFDVAAGGQNRLRAASNVLFNYVGNTEGDLNALQNMGGADTDFVLINPDDPAAGYTNTSGLKFDSDFAADYWFALGNGGNTPESVELYGNSAVLRTGGRRETTNGSPLDYRSYSGGLVNGNPPATTPSPVVFAGPTINPLLDPTFGFPLDGDKEAQYAPRVNADVMANADPALRVPVANLIALKLDNSNIGGVTATTGSAAAAAAVTTGMEFSIDLAELGWDETSEIKLAGFISNGGYNFISNQIIGSSWDGTGTAPGNAGSSRVVDFSNDTAFPGKQWISLTAAVNPCPNPSNISGPGQNTTAIDGELTADDIIVFLNRFFAGNLLSDVSGPGQNTTALDGELTADDIIVFLNRFFAGC